MSELKVRNFGPIKAGYQGKGGWLDIKKVMVLVGNQGSGKSTVAKLISTCIWMEKALVRGGIKAKDLETPNRFRKKYCAYQNIHNFFAKIPKLSFEEWRILSRTKIPFSKLKRTKPAGILFPKSCMFPRKEIL